MPLLYWYAECCLFAFGMGATLGAIATTGMTSAWGIGGLLMSVYGLYRLLRDMPAMWAYVFKPEPPVMVKRSRRKVK